MLPTGDIVVHDEFDTGTENYKEFWWTMVGLAGESQNFDGNGSYVRFQPGGGAEHGRARRRELADRPAHRLDARRRCSACGRSTPASARRTTRACRCHKSKIPDVNGPWGARGAGEATP